MFFKMSAKEFNTKIEKLGYVIGMAQEFVSCNHPDPLFAIDRYYTVVGDDLELMTYQQKIVYIQQVRILDFILRDIKETIKGDRLEKLQNTEGIEISDIDPNIKNYHKYKSILAYVCLNQLIKNVPFFFMNRYMKGI